MTNILLNYSNKEIPCVYYGFIYKTIFPNGKIYIGQTTKRVNELYFGSGGIYFKNAINKYGKKCLKRIILKFVQNKKSLDIFEHIYIKKCKSDNSNFGYNEVNASLHVKFGMNNPSKIPEVVDRIKKTKERIGFSTKGEKNGMFGKKYKKGEHAITGMKFKCITNGIKDRKIGLTDDIPIGWWVGRSFRHKIFDISKVNVGKFWITNGIIDRLTKSDIPIGFVKGRTNGVMKVKQKHKV